MSVPEVFIKLADDPLITVNIEDIRFIDHGKALHPVVQQIHHPVVFMIVSDEKMFQIFGMELEFEFLSHRIRTEINADMVIEFVGRPEPDVLAAV